MDALHEDLLQRLLQSLPGRAWRALGAAAKAPRSALRGFLAERDAVKLTQMAFRCRANGGKGMEGGAMAAWERAWDGLYGLLLVVTGT